MTRPSLPQDFFYELNPLKTLLNEINNKLDLLLKNQGKECTCELHNQREDIEWHCSIHGHRVIGYRSLDKALNHAYPKIKKL